MGSLCVLLPMHWVTPVWQGKTPRTGKYSTIPPQDHNRNKTTPRNKDHPRNKTTQNKRPLILNDQNYTPIYL